MPVTPPTPSIFTWAFRSRQLRTDAKAYNINVTVQSLSSSPPVPYTPRICRFRRTNVFLTPGTGRSATRTRPLCKLPGFRNVIHLRPETRCASFPIQVLRSNQTGTHQPDHVLERERPPIQDTRVYHGKREGSKPGNACERACLPTSYRIQLTHIALDLADAWCTFCWLYLGILFGERADWILSLLNSCMVEVVSGPLTNGVP